MQAGRELDKRIEVIRTDWKTATQDLGERHYSFAELKEYVAAEKRIKDAHIPFLLEEVERLHCVAGSLNGQWGEYWNRIRRFAENNNLEDVERFMSDLECEMLA